MHDILHDLFLGVSIGLATMPRYPEQVADEYHGEAVVILVVLNMSLTWMIKPKIQAIDVTWVRQLRVICRSCPIDHLQSGARGTPWF